MDETHLGQSKAGAGIAGLDDILAGGFSRGHVFLLEGNPGTGKTTMALRFLLQGAEQGEKCLYITLSETELQSLGQALPRMVGRSTRTLKSSSWCRLKACSRPTRSRRFYTRQTSSWVKRRG